MLAQPAVALEVEVLPVVLGQAIALLAGRQLVVERAVAPRIDLRQVAKIEQAAAQELRRPRSARAGCGERPGFESLPFALAQRGHRGVHLAARSRRRALK